MVMLSQALWPGGNFWRLPRETSRFDPPKWGKKKKLAIVKKKKKKKKRNGDVPSVFLLQSITSFNWKK
jgi:hypothetical protein